MSHDVIVIGAGHNGLTAAAYLARAGLRVVVLEASPTSGGMLGTNAIFPSAPNHLINEGGIQASMFRSTSIIKDLELDRHGLRQIIADPFHVHLDPDGSSLAFWKDPARTAEELKRFSHKDARAYLEFANQCDAAMDLALPFMNGHPTRPSGKEILKAIPKAVRRRKELTPLISFLTRSHAEIITERFDTPLLQAALASMPPFCWMTQDGTGWALIYVAICHKLNSSRMAGGSGSLPAAIQRSFESSGGTVRTSARVQELLLDGNNKITGVRLEGGEVLRAPYVLASCSPKATLTDLLPRGVLDDTMQRRADAIPIDTVEAASLKIDVALDGQLTLPRHQAWRKDDLNLREPIIAWQTFDEHIRAWEDTIAGRWPDPICGIGIIPSALDPSQAPPGKDTFWYWSGITPAHPTEPWKDVRDKIGDRALGAAAEIFEGLDSMVIERRVFNIPDLETRFNVPGGNVYHVDPALMRMGPLRPASGFGSYHTPVEGLFLSGAGTHPTGGISGIPGQQSAKWLLKKMGKK
ncbi:phytoene desaturase family protein [Pseudonocardia spinosispora]|uniref:phytoene desaturase family protein n=1 Tax=Pseudonocardia spinosispora TaxID=103441 RepID=UPI000420DE96|nr:NAD(P)/FAD-dependent oxidoreductase [Pseudonocardia spinosispora]